MQVFLQLWGGIILTISKFCFSRAERTVGDERQLWWRWSWILNLVGLPPWAIIFAMKGDWIAAGFEWGGYIGAILGLVIANRGIERKPVWLDWIARFTASAGVGVSIYTFGTIFTLQQGLEFTLAIGFLVGTYQIAHGKLRGYLWFLAMHAAAATLMYMQDVSWLGTQQVVSFGFVLDAYCVKKLSRKADGNVALSTSSS